MYSITGISTPQINDGIKVFTRTSENLLTKEVVAALEGLRDVLYPSKEGEYGEVIKPVSLVRAWISKFLLPVGHPAGHKQDFADTTNDISNGNTNLLGSIRDNVTTLLNNQEQLQIILHLASLKGLKVDSSVEGEGNIAGYEPQLYPDIDMLFIDDDSGKDKTVEELLTEIQKKTLSPSETKRKLSQVKIKSKKNVNPEMAQRKRLLEKQRKESDHIPVDVDSSKAGIFLFARESAAFEVVSESVREVLNAIGETMQDMVDLATKENKQTLLKQQYYLQTYIIGKLMPADNLTIGDANLAEAKKLRDTLWLFDTFGLGSARIEDRRGLAGA